MRWRLAFVVLVAVYVLLLPVLTDHLKTRPVEVKLGYLPHPQVLKVASGEHRTTVSENFGTTGVVLFRHDYPEISGECDYPS